MDTFFQILIYHGEVITLPVRRSVCVCCRSDLSDLSADGGAVEEGGIPGHARVRELQTPAAGTSGRRSGAAAHALPNASLHRHGARRQPGEGAHAQSQNRAHSSWEGGDDDDVDAVFRLGSCCLK